MAASTTPGKAPQYFTTKAEVKTGKGQVVRFAKGKGYFAGAPVPTAGPNPYAMYGLTPAELRSMVTSQVNSEISPQEAALKSAQATSDHASAIQQRTLEALTRQYADMLGGIGPSVHGAYDTAANTVAGYGKGFSDVIQGQLDNAGAAEKGLLGVAGTPDAQASAALGHLAAPTDALYGLGGALPAGSLQREGAAFTAAADQLPAFAVGRGQENALALAGAQDKTDAGFRQQLSQLLAQIPTLRVGAQNNILKNARSDVAEQLLLNKYGLQQRTELGNLTGVDPATGQPTYKAATAATKAAQAAATKHNAAIGRRDKATSSLLTKMSTWVYQQRHKQGAVVVGYEPRERTTKDPAGLTVTQYLTPSGWVTAAHPPANVIKKPIYDEHHQVPANYNSMRSFITRQLTVGLKAYGYKPSDIAEMVTELLGPPPQAPIPPSDLSATHGLGPHHAPGRP